MLDVLRTTEFDRWLNDLRDTHGRVRILKRLDRLPDGNFGDAAPVGEGVSELRLHFGPGYRVYFVQRGVTIIILLCGGDKSSQADDIAMAKELARRASDGFRSETV